MATLSRRDVEHVAHLARLGLSDEEVSALQGQLNHILEQFAVLDELDTAAIPPTARVIDVENVLREDAVRPGLERAAVLALAPEHDSAQVIVPAVLGEGSDG